MFSQTSSETSSLTPEEQQETSRDRESRRQKESQNEFIECLKRYFGSRRFTIDEVKKAKLGNPSGGFNKKERVFQAVEDNLIKATTENSIRYYQLID